MFMYMHNNSGHLNQNLAFIRTRNIKNAVSLPNRGYTACPGFTLIELLIVIAILATLLGIALPLLSSYIDKAKIARAQSEIRTIEKEIIAFNLETNRYPYTLAEIGLANFKDPYGNPYQYVAAPTSERGSDVKSKMRKDRNLHPVNTDFDLYSMGKDGKSQPPFTAKVSQDDVVRANNGQFVGPVYLY